MTSNLYERIGVLSLEEVFPYIEKHLDEKVKRRINIGKFFVNVQSLRLRTFLHSGISCSCCPNQASFFAVERNRVKPGKNDKAPYHLNLYGINELGEEILFTHDHVLARALGGEDNLENTTTACGPCNWEKGRLEGRYKASQDQNEKEELKQLILNYTNKQTKKVKP